MYCIWLVHVLHPGVKYKNSENCGPPLGIKFDLEIGQRSPSRSQIVPSERSCHKEHTCQVSKLNSENCGPMLGIKFDLEIGQRSPSRSQHCTIGKVLSQRTHMPSIKALPVIVQKLWPKVKVFVTDRQTDKWDLMSPRFRESGGQKHEHRGQQFCFWRAVSHTNGMQYYIIVFFTADPFFLSRSSMKTVGPIVLKIITRCVHYTLCPRGSEVPKS